MLENEFHISELIGERLKGNLNAEQEAELNAWIELNEENRLLLEELEGTKISEEILHFVAVDKASIWDKTIKGIQNEDRKKPVLSLWTRWSIAATLFLIAGMSLFFYINNRDAGLNQKQEEVYENDILAGRNGATLTLADGRKLQLATAAQGQLANEAGIKISKTADGKIVYELSSLTAQNPKGRYSGTEPSYNTLATNKGEQYQVVLPDKSIVWLNAASALRFPASFVGMKNRIVLLEGEAYFEIAKDKRHPFMVKVARQEITVLGTHFNITAYKDDADIKTTLLEGSIQMNNDLVMKPSEQYVSNDQRTELKNVDVMEVIAWKQGDFIFRNQELTASMKQIARWYNVEVIYEPGAPKKLKLGGSISRSNPLSVVLRTMERTGKVKFKLEGRRVIVSKV
ncbi:FecR domain-containing protein [Pedobacter sp. MC2016-14]|uniref:FecR family protein n=1 Tax=Pedobacter sp. MC2016-14 TaxID=2897327 RepID=UPI001E3A9FCF|nr:FecR domain-containing protein [Pedobacter sp. MC2016-14]MCD0489804.1 FecR domain-containing protein [Pedobacter sp. MC2016-14]